MRVVGVGLVVGLAQQVLVRVGRRGMLDDCCVRVSSNYPKP